MVRRNQLRDKLITISKEDPRRAMKMLVKRLSMTARISFKWTRFKLASKMARVVGSAKSSNKKLIDMTMEVAEKMKEKYKKYPQTMFLPIDTVAENYLKDANINTSGIIAHQASQPGGLASNAN